VNFDDEHEAPALPDGGVPQSVDPGDPATQVSAAPARFVQEDLRVPWGWVDLVLFVLVAIAAGSVLLIAMLIAFIALGHHSSELQGASRTTGVFGVIYEVLLFGALIGCLALYVRLRFGTPFWRTIGWRPLEGSRFPVPLPYLGFIGGGFLLAIVVQVLSVYFGQNAKVPMEALFQDRVVALLLLLLAVLMAPLVEETLFRGLLYPVIARSFGRGIGVVVTGTLFGLLHAAQLWGGWTQIALLVFVGIVLTYARAVTRTVLASFLLHISYNFCISLAFLIGSHWLRVLPTGS